MTIDDVTVWLRYQAQDYTPDERAKIEAACQVLDDNRP